MPAGARPLLIPLLLHALLAGALWSSGSLHGTWTFECGVGQTAWDLVHGGNPHFAWSDYYDSWTSGYLLFALVQAPLMALPIEPIVAVKLSALLTTAAAALFAFLFLREVTDRRWAVLGATGLIFGPPALWTYSAWAGNYHYTELVPCLALFWRVSVWTKRNAWGPRGALELGLLAGLAVTTSLGALLPVALAMVAFAVVRPRRMVRPATYLALVGIAAGLLPLILKALNDPFGVPPAEGEFEMPYFSGVRQPLLAKAAALPALLSQHIGFGELKGALAPLDLVYGGLILALVAGVLVALPKLRGDPSRLLRLLPALWIVGLLAIYLALPTHMPPRSIASDYRDVRWLPPLLACAPLALAAAGPSLPRGLGRLGWALPVMGLVGVLALIPWGDVSGSVPLVGRCPQLQGLYAGKVLPPTPRGEAEDPPLCAPFGDRADDCERGRAQSVAVYAMARGELASRSGVGAVASTCAALPAPEQRACFRQLGWALTLPWTTRDPLHLWSHLKDECASLATTRRQAWCREGMGYWFVDHLGGWPERLPGFLTDAPPQVVELTMRGVGARLGELYVGDVSVACQRYGGSTKPCLDGAASVRE